MTGAAFRDILGDRRSATCCIFQYKTVSKMGRVRCPKRRVRDDDFVVGSRRNVVGCRRMSSECRRISLNRVCIGGSNSGMSPRNLELRISWQAQYLVKLEGDSCCSARCK